MNAGYVELAERFRGEVPEIERATHRALASWTQLKKLPQDDAYVDSVALNLHSFYSGLERLFELTARHIDCVVPTGETWHRDLLHRMVQDIEGVRPALVSPDNAAKLDEFRRFRHLSTPCVHNEPHARQDGWVGIEFARVVGKVALRGACFCRFPGGIGAGRLTTIIRGPWKPLPLANHEYRITNNCFNLCQPV